MVKSTTLGQKHIVCEKTFYKETGREKNFFFGKCSECDGKKSMIVSDDTIVAEGSGDFFMNLGNKRLNASKKVAKNVLRNPGRALEIRASVCTAFATRSPRAAFSSEVINFCDTGRGLYFGKVV